MNANDTWAYKRSHGRGDVEADSINRRGISIPTIQFQSMIYGYKCIEGNGIVGHGRDTLG